MARRKYIALFLCAALLGTLCGCSQKEAGEEYVSDLSGHATVSKVTLTEGKYSEEKLDDTWDENAAISLKLEEDRISASGVSETGMDGVMIEGSTATISKAGTYILSGSLKDGQIVVDADKNDYVKLVLNGADITCADSAPIYSKGGNLIITLAENTENTVTDGESYVFEEGEDEPSAAIFAKDDLSFNGKGALYVNANYNHAVQSKDDLKFVAGTYVMKAAGDAVVGKDSVSVKDGNFTIESGEDGIKATNIEDPGKGYVLIENGTFQITAGGDGIQAETLLRVNDGKLDIVTGGGSGEAVITGDMMEDGFHGRGEMKEGEAPEGGERPEGEMLQEGDKLELEKPEGGDRPEGEIPQGGKGPKGEMPQDGNKPEGEMSQGGDRPEGEMPEGEVPQGEVPQGGEKPEGESDFSGDPPQEELQEKNDTPGTNTDTSENGEGVVSTKALKSYVELVIAGGEFELDSYDDGLHSNQNVTIEDGAFTIQAGDDGIHADRNLTIDGGTIDITQSYEGLEGFDIVINAGDIKVVASDDGVNAAGDDDSAQNPEDDATQQASDEKAEKEDSPAGNEPQMKRGGFMAGEDQGATMTVNGGTLYVNANGDGLDANGDILLSGGTVTVHGPASGGNGTLDYATSCKIIGGVFLGVGSMGMAQNPSDDSTQPSLVGTLDSAVEAGTTISVKTTDGATIASVVTEKRTQWYAISSPELKQGESYIVCVGEKEKTVELSEAVTEVK
ncbi:carbohydrate-binding domain-containing protein [Roseburia hominis]